MHTIKRPSPLFDTLDHLTSSRNGESAAAADLLFPSDFDACLDFLKQYHGSEATFRAYRREIERLLQWSWHVAKKSILELKRADIEVYIEFCKKPPLEWIGTQNVSRFVMSPEGTRVPNPNWRLFVSTVSKADFKKGLRANPQAYTLSQKSIREIFTVTSSLFSHLVNEGKVEINPVLLIRQKSKYFTTRQGSKQIPRLTQMQWVYCIETAESLAKKNPEKYERTLFIMNALYLLYLRISELSASSRWEPQMGHFYKDSKDQWWFLTLGKGNKERNISVSDDMLNALKRYRLSLGLPPLPSPTEKHPLIKKLKGPGGVESDREIRRIVQECFDLSVDKLRHQNHLDEADALENATVHWLRHTGISDDINMRGRPESHVRDDAGHSSILITDRYNDVVLQERYLSGKNKKAKPTEKQSGAI